MSAHADTTIGPLTAAAIAMGLPVFPCNAEKQPIVATGFKAATKERAQIAAAFDRPGAEMIGIPTGAASGLVVIDVDVKDGHDGRPWLEENMDVLPPTRTHKTRSGGRHLIFAMPTDVDIRNSAGRIAPGVDVRGSGGYFVAPPSPGYSVTDATEPAEMPRWLIRACLPPERTPQPHRPVTRTAARASGGTSYGLKALADECAAVRSAPFGRQEDTLNSAALKIGALIAGAEIEEGIALSDLRAAGNSLSNESGRDPWMPDQIDAKIRRAVKDGARQPRSAPARPETHRAGAPYDTAPPELDAGGTVAEFEALADVTPESAAPSSPNEAPEPEAKVEPPAEDDTAAIDANVAKFNAKYMVVNETGKALVYAPCFDPILRRRRLERIGFPDLRNLYLNRRIEVGIDSKGNPVFKNAASLWLTDHRRRQFINGVIFDPSGENDDPETLNLWQGFAVKPAPGDWSILKDHIKTNLCDGDPVLFDYLMGWMARMFQNPAEQGEVAIVMKGGEGTGKGTLARAIRHILGQHGIAISNAKHLVGNFNAHLRDAVFLFADEAFFAGDRAHVGVLKALITEGTLTIEAKYANAVEVPNYLHMMMASNEEWVVPASLDARRFLVLLAGNLVKNNHDYFGKLWAQMAAGGYEAMLHDLLAMDLTTFNVRAVPQTEGLQSQKKLSLGTTESWWQDCLERGYVFRSKLGLEAVLSAWHAKISTELLFASYIEFASRRGERRLLSREGFGGFFVGFGAEPKRWRNGLVGEHIIDVGNMHGGTSRKAEIIRQDRAHGYSLGTLDEARATFENFTGLTVVWDGGAPDDMDD